MRLSLAIWNPSSGVHFVVVAMAIPALAQTTLFWASVPLPEMMLVSGQTLQLFVPLDFTL
jgi:hypothetical protein